MLNEVAPMETEGLESTTRFSEVQSRWEYCARNIWPIFVQVCIVTMLFLSGLAIDGQPVFAANFYYFLGVVFAVDVCLRCRHGDRQEACFRSNLCCDALVTAVYLLPLLEELLELVAEGKGVTRLRILKLMRAIRVLVLVRVKDVLFSLHRKATRSPRILDSVVLAGVLILVVMYVFAIVLRVHTLITKNGYFDSTADAMLFMAPGGLIAVLIYICLSVRASRSLARSLPQEGQLLRAST